MYQLTKPQRLIYDMEKFAGGSIATICGSIMIEGKQNTETLINAVNELYRLNDALRIRIIEKEGTPFQAINGYTEQQTAVLHFAQRSEFYEYAENYAKESMDFYGSLCQIQIILLDDAYGILVKMHHIISDAWTLTLIGSQFHALVNGETPKTYSYLDYMKSEQQYLESTRYQKDKAYFAEQFKKCDETTYISDKQSHTYTSKRRTFLVGKENTARITSFAEKNNTSVYTLLMMALGIYISRIKMNQEKFYIGTAVLNRNGHREQNTMGMFVNTVPVLFEIENRASFMENLDKFSENRMQMLRHQKFNYGEVKRTLHREFDFSGNLYDVMFSFQNTRLSGITDEFESRWYHCGMDTESLAVHVDDRDGEGVLKIHYDYQTEKYDEAEIEKMHTHLFWLLSDAMKNPDKPIYALEMLTEEEKHKLIYVNNDTKAEYPKEKCVHQLIEEQVLAAPDKTAVIACDRTLTYYQLNEEANRIAHSLLEQGVQVGDIVPLILPRRSYLLTAILGVLKAGAAFLPVDPDYPQERIDFMVEDSGAGVWVTQNNVQEYSQHDNTDNPQVKMSSESLCYCIYTSGSTGRPKGTLLRHRNVTNFVTNYVNNVTEECRRKVSVSTVSFDVFAEDSIVMLASGKEILFANEEEAKLQFKLNQLVLKHGGDMLIITPTKLKSLIADKDQRDYLKKFKWIEVGGEVLEKEFARQLKELTKAKITNIYGPTETTVFSTSQLISDENDITIGRPIVNTQIYIVDKFMRIVPEGVVGELCIAGDGVGAGYRNRPELMEEKFPDNPFGEGKLYKTGDLAYWREDGNIVYVGRNDFQVKVRGLRIELGEIENAIRTVEGVVEAVVIVRKDEHNRQYICAFYTEQFPVDTADIRKAVLKELPNYMLPHVFTVLDKMPETASGKISRRALPDVDLSQISNKTAYVKPETGLQKELAAIMESVLDYEPIGLYDNFFDLGGDSLKAIEFVSRAHSQGIYFNLQEVFDSQTIGGLCEKIESHEKREVTFDDEDFSQVHCVLQRNKDADAEVYEKCDVGNLLLTGATGYLGIHILARYLEQEEGTAYCLVRGADEDESLARFKELLAFYFGEKYQNLLEDRICVLCGDLNKEMFGLSETRYKELVFDTKTVINAAASVKHYGSYEYFKESNVYSVEKLLEFCNQSGARLIHISTLSVSGNGFSQSGDFSGRENWFAETNLYIGQNLDNVYARSKFESEKLVLDAAVQGMDVCIMRMGNLTNRMDGKFQKNYESNAFLKRIRAFFAMGMYPDSLKCFPVEFTPVDEAARAVMMLTGHFHKNHTVFHICNSQTVCMEKLMGYVTKLGLCVQAADEETFARKMRDAEQSGAESVLEAFINDMDEKDHLKFDNNIRIDSTFTEKVLGRLGFQWQEPDEAYIRRYVEYFREMGVF